MTRKHLLLMLACCLLVPVAALAAIFIFDLSLSAVLLFGLFLICPLSHFFLMKYLGHGYEVKAKPLDE